MDDDAPRERSGLRRGYSSGELGRRPRVTTNVMVLTFANLGLLSFFISGVQYVLAGWDQTAIFCVLGYVFCGVALAVPSLTFSKPVDEGRGDASTEKEEKRLEDRRLWWRVLAAVLNVAGLLLGITGSLLYSPGFCKWASSGQFDPYVREEEFEYITDRANVIWAISFILFPIGSGLFLYDKKLTLQEKAALRHAPAPGFFSQELYLYTWIEIALVIFAVGGMLFCFDENNALLISALILFFIGGSIKAGLMFHEVKNFFGSSCEEVTDVDGERSPLLSSHGSSESSSLLGDAEV